MGVKNRKSPKSWRPKEHVEEVLEEWLKKNPTIDHSTLVNLAVYQYVTQNQTLAGVDYKGVQELSDQQAERMTQDLLKEHAYTIEKLK